MDPRLTHLIDWLRSTAAAAEGLLVPISGGSDSALCFWICTRALPGRASAVYFGEALRSQSWFEALGPVEIQPSPVGDRKQREVRRWLAVLELCVQRQHWLVGSRNRTEEVFGTYSVASRVSACLPLAGLWKSEVMELCAQVGVPAEVTASSRRADPDCGRPVEMAEIRFELIDLFLRVQEGELPAVALSALSAAEVCYLETILAQNRFKRGLPMRGPTLAPEPLSAAGGMGLSRREEFP
jgi:NH3-dependent NAD+ synthetase